MLYSIWNRLRNGEKFMKQDKDDDRKIYLDFLRIFASFAVIILHIASEKWYGAKINTFDWNIYNIYDGIVRWAVPVFVMISGTLFLDKDKPLKEIYKKYILRIAIAFLVWSFIYALVSYIQDGTTVKQFIFAFIKGPGHLWYLLMIMGLYAIIPFVKLIIKDEKLIKYFLILAFIFAFVAQQGIAITSQYFKTLGGILNKVFRNININFVLGYTSYFILGYYLSKKKIPQKYNKIIYCFGIIGFISTVLFTYLTSKQIKIYNTVFYEYLTVNVLLEAIFVFIFFKNLLSNYNPNKKAISIIKKLSKYSFGAYLVHMLVIKELTVLKFISLPLNPIISVPLLSLVVIIISYIISALINKIPVIKKYVVWDFTFQNKCVIIHLTRWKENGLSLRRHN